MEGFPVRVPVKMASAVLLGLAALQVGAASATAKGCLPLRDGKPVSGNQDVLARLLTGGDSCPTDVHAFRARIRDAGGVLATAFIGNRGFHNPGAGSFSLFEMASGDLGPLGKVDEGELFFGHFTVPAGSRLVLDQDPRPDSLMIEAIAWDAGKGLFNFYELRGNGAAGAWRYNGDSSDIVADVEGLHRQRAGGQAPFGDRLRCSGCHVGGGPIVKELSPPHNDWWTRARPLPLGGRQLDPSLARIAEGFVDGGRLVQAVRAGVTRLQASPQYRALVKTRSLQERLRPLFCPLELNLASDPLPLDEKAASTTLPSALLVDPRLAEGELKVARADYEAALQSVGSRFPETQRRDADHAWLGPVKSFSDQAAVQPLIEENVVDAEFVSDVLAVDITDPLSEARCQLLRLVPADAAADWPARLRSALRSSSQPEAATLLANLDDPGRNAASHRSRAQGLLAACRQKLTAAGPVTSMLRLLGRRRDAIDRGEISQNPQGKILEPGFRVVFPVQVAPSGSGPLRLSETCDVVEG